MRWLRADRLRSVRAGRRRGFMTWLPTRSLVRTQLDSLQRITHVKVYLLRGARTRDEGDACFPGGPPTLASLEKVDKLERAKPVLDRKY